jgi:hypothetical protein
MEPLIRGTGSSAGALARHDSHLPGTGRIGILAGGGRLPMTIAEAVTERGGSVHIVAIEGEADSCIARFPHTWVNWGQVGRMVSALAACAGRICGRSGPMWASSSACPRSCG